MHAVTSPRAVWASAAAVVLALGLLSSTPPTLHAQAGTQGQWRTLTNQAPINPVHVALMNNGEVLIVSGSGNVATETLFQAAVWDPLSQIFQTQTIPWDMFCNGMVVLHDGRVFVNGGNLQYDPFFGEPRSAVFDPQTHTFTAVQNMAHGRWYPTVDHAGRWPRDDVLRVARDRRHQHRRRDLHRGLGMESGVSSGLDAAALSAHAPEHGWSGVLRR